MTPQTFTAALMFALVMAVTPGPNNTMLASSGATHGLKPTLPHLAGVCIGFAMMVQVVGFGLAAVLLASPMLQLAMKTVSCAYLLWLALQIARSAGLAGAATRGRPMTFLQACAFQWINPKAWLTAVGAISAYTAGRGAQVYWQVTILALICLVVAVPATFVWASFGAAIRKWLRAPKALHAFNVLMALLLVASVVPILIEIGNALRG
jgi:threonine/homoserine/homoserine lactone efflux protein